MQNTIQTFRLAALQVAFFEKKYKFDYRRFLIILAINNEANTSALISEATDIKLDDVRVLCADLINKGYLDKKKEGIYALFSCTQKALDFIANIEKENNH